MALEREYERAQESQVIAYVVQVLLHVSRPINALSTKLYH